MRDDPVVTDLVTTARNGDKQAWDALVERYAPLVWSICRRHQLGDTDAENVGQIVWLQLLDHLQQCPSIRPRFPAGWPPRPGGNAAGSCAQRGDRKRPGMRRTLMSTRRRTDQHGRAGAAGVPSATPRCTRRSCSPPCDQQLIALLNQDPPAPSKISSSLGIPVGGIGPTRGRCLDRLRRHPALER